MQAIWSLTIYDYLAICEKAKANGKKPGDSMQEEFLEYMKEKNIKPIGHTELNSKELLEEYKSKGYKVLDLRDKVDKDE